MKKYIAEVIGTFGLIFCGTGAMIINEVTNGVVTHPGVAVTWGLIVMTMIYGVGSISGAHMNPAVTIAFWAGRLFPTKDLLPYFVAQGIGAFLASFLLRILFPDSISLGETIPSGTVMQSFILEIILTYFLMFVILSSAIGNKDVGHFAGVVIGMVVLLEALFAGPICGASMNPIRSIAPAVVNGNTIHLWAYIVGPITGALLAVFSWKAIQPTNS